MRGLFVLVALMLGACTHVRRDQDPDKPQVVRLVVVVCVFSSCHHLAQPDPAPAAKCEKP